VGETGHGIQQWLTVRNTVTLNTLMSVNALFIRFHSARADIRLGFPGLCWPFTQNHRMFGVGRDLCGSSSPPPLPKQGHPEQAAQDLVRVGLEYLQRWRLHNPSGQPVPVLRHPQREEVLPHVHPALLSRSSPA